RFPLRLSSYTYFKTKGTIS
ncbi:3,4-dihydroxy-2-butanone-4-phosphate synthase, partial [Vibrio parahaemolyticus V-223/04]